METEKTMEAGADRIRYMEALYEQTLSLLKQGGKTEAGEQAVKTLTAYMESGKWMEDYELDRAGLLPKELKRGVLSQDGLYNLLTDWDARFNQN